MVATASGVDRTGGATNRGLTPREQSSLGAGARDRSARTRRWEECIQTHSMEGGSCGDTVEYDDKITQQDEATEAKAERSGDPFRTAETEAVWAGGRSMSLTLAGAFPRRVYSFSS